MELSIVIPTHNEPDLDEWLTSVDVTLKYCDAEIIVVDDASDEPFVTRNKRVKVIRFDKNRGKGAAVKTGISFATKTNTLVMDADRQVGIDNLAMLEMVGTTWFSHACVGSKYHKYSRVNYTFKRWIISQVYRWIVKILFRLPIEDTQCGFKLFSTQAVQNVLPMCKINRFAYDVELLTAMYDSGYRVVDAPIVMGAPKGKGSVSLKAFYETLRDTVIVWLRRRHGSYRYRLL